MITVADTAKTAEVFAKGKRNGDGIVPPDTIDDEQARAVANDVVACMGGAMDLVHGAKKVVVLMEHVARDGSCKVVNECSLPYTGRRVVQRIITDLCVLDVTPDGLRLVELAPDVTADEVRMKTEPSVQVPDH